MLGSDESLGGALLTPISWLRGESEMDYTPNGVTQGELLRQEQELGIVHENGEEILHAHAQGPPELGPEDLGPQPAGLVFPDLNSPPSEPVHARIDEVHERVDVPMAGAEGPSADAPSTATGQSEDVMDVDSKTSGDGNGVEQATPPSEAQEPVAGNDTAMESMSGTD